MKKINKLVPCMLITWDGTNAQNRKYFGFLCDTKKEAIYKSVSKMTREKLDEGVLAQVNVNALITASLGESINDEDMRNCKKLCTIKKNSKHKLVVRNYRQNTN